MVFEWERSAGFGRRAVVQPGNGAIFAGCCRFRDDESEHGDNLARSVFVQPKHAQDKSCGLTAEIQARIGSGTKCGERRDVSRGTILHSGQLTPRSASLCHSEEPATKNLCASSYSRSHSRRIPAEEMKTVFRLKLRLVNPVRRFFTDSTTALVRTTASVRQNDNVRAEWDVRRPNGSHPARRKQNRRKDQHCFT